ncbi:MAG: 7,8-didemethyl-8-hydroxy-5-deazariboflavin synthase subunit CofG [Herbiconiux sp.]|uniref:7,8-didemethyl-8-hydroxy-5-deazariboflavin synthase CofG n=1 Tax=Herbiconiux sp. TaxID=1871186 RepID=UPI00120A2FDE|nr:7,8-didemethyl-8-hydroxy-5-deazariboflavin synthase CofG [Herbiconiux sp.]TAJ47036.1 MAG: 7,8-didemethyl-8-hydroxy-5-deazariboflavin synthase subunit CofG [Herbiconiux sp.]
MTHDLTAHALALAESRRPLTLDEIESLFSARGDELDRLLALASSLRDEGLARRGRPGVITFSKKVFLPITTLCRDRCHYCIFVDTPGKLKAKGKAPFMSADEILAIARQGAALGCKEALFTLGDRPEERWEIAREWLAEHGYESTLDYIRDMAQRVLDETGLLPHLNPGVMSWAEMQRLRPVAPSMGMMLETTSRTLWSEKGQPHYGSPDKDPAVRLQVLEDAGRSRIPFSTGVLLGIGETLRDRAESLLAIRESDERFGHIQETIVQNFRSKPGTAMQNDDDLGLGDYIASVAVARVVLGPDASIQVPPNLTDAAELGLLVRAGIDDWGGVSPLTPDHVNPERAWPQIETLARLTAEAGFTLHERLTAHPRYVQSDEHWIDDRLLPQVRALAEPTTGLADESAPVRPHTASVPDEESRSSRAGVSSTSMAALISRAEGSPAALSDADYVTLLSTRGRDLDALSAVADGIRSRRVGDAVTFVANRNLDLARLGVDLSLEDVAAIADEAVSRGMTEVCAQGAFAPHLAAETPFLLARAISSRGLHLHAFRPAEILAGAAQAGQSLDEHLIALRESGVASVPGTGARILDDTVRAQLSGGTDMPAAEWIRVITAAHRHGLPSTATMVYGHVESPAQIVAHLRTLARIQDETGGFREFILMPHVPVDTPGIDTRPPAGLDESRAVHAVSRLLLDGRIDHHQAAWPKHGLRATALLLASGADDIGGLLDPGILFPTVGAEAGRAIRRSDVEQLARDLGRGVRQRSTSYETVVPMPATSSRPYRALELSERV